MARSKGNGRKKSSKQAIKAKNTYNHKASESLYGSPRKSMLKFNPDLYGSPKKAILKQKNAKGKAKTTKKGSKKSNAKSSKNKTKQEKTSTSTARSAQMNNRKRSQKNAPRVNNSVRKFKLQMPSVGPNAPPAPWWKYSPPFSLSSLVKGSTGTIYSSKKEATKILDTISVNVDAIRQLDKELEAFGRYVRLIPLECQARDHLIYTIQQAAGDLFGIQPSDCKIFGSYAARPVCTFESDVDLAIFGVVEPDSSGSEEEEEEDDSEEGSLPSPKLVKNHPNRKKQEKILKWKFAINENEQIHQKDKEGEVKAKPKQQEEKTIEAIEAYKPQNQEGEIGVTEEDSPLFMIDRVGEPESNDNHPLLDNNLKETGTSAVGICSSQFEDAAEGNQVIIEDVENTKSDKDVSSQFSDAPEGESTVVMAAEETRTSNPVIGRDDFLAKNQTSCCTEDSIYKDNDSQGSDEDNVDKLEGLKSSERCVKNTDDDHGFRGFRTLNLPGADDTHDGGNFGSISREKDDDSDYSEEEEMITKPRSHSVISLSSSTTCSDNETWDESGMEVSFITAPSQSSAARRSRASVVGPTGETRTCVVRALNTLSRRIRKFNFNTQVFVRKHARVPIINLETCFGYECDIALGGHNGTDTSAYASNQISKSCRYV